jgi:beta-alanine--pyruvate transaminase
MTLANSLDAFWLPFTNNRGFKALPRMFAGAKGMHYVTPDGRRILDGTAGLWCVNAGHGRERIVEAIRRQAGALDFAPTFQLAHPLAFEFANRLAALVGGIAGNRRWFGPLLPGTDHLRHTYDPRSARFVDGQPQTGADLADDLERLVTLHGAETIAAVIIEPVAGSTGVLVPPVGYLRRLREIATRYGILLIFDEVITAFGRLGAATASEHFGVTPDLITCAKGLTNAAVPAGAVMVSGEIYRSVVDSAPPGIELFHGYTYSAHPLACAAGMAALDIYAEEGLFERARSLCGYFGDAAHALCHARHVIDIRNIGLVAGIELEPRPDAPGVRAMDVFHRCFDEGLLVRVTGDTIALSPPLIVEKAQIDEMFAKVAAVLSRTE